MNNEVEKVFPTVWNDLLENRNITPQEKPLGIVLGGIPGSGKSILIEKIEKELNKNIIPINGDDFRIYHPNFKEIYAEHKGDFPKYTSDFSNKMVERVIEEAVKNKFNIVVEGTFRNPNVPIGTLSTFEEQGYNTRAMIIATDKNIAWESTINRYNRDLENGFYARKVELSSFEEVATNLAKNTKIVLDSGKASLLEVYSRESKLFDSRVNSPKELESLVNNELQGLNRFKKDNQLSNVLAGETTHKDISQKGINSVGKISSLERYNQAKKQLLETKSKDLSSKDIER